MKYFNVQYNIFQINRQIFDLRDTNSTNKWFDSLDNSLFFDAVIHTAIKGGNRLESDNSSVLDDNIRMYLNLLNHKHRYKKFINIGSGAEKYSPDSFYGLSKKIIASSLADKENCYNLRIYGVFDQNELERRFIKSNIIRYIQKENIIIHHDKLMDFIYLSDFIKIVQKYIDYENIPKTLDCVYEQKYSLINIANIINGLGDHRVSIDLQNQKHDSDYIGNYYDIHIKFCGLEHGISETYRKIKDEKNMVCPQ
jgi:nucleoside-diphosphate-sugar epimerase